MNLIKRSNYLLFLIFLAVFGWLRSLDASASGAAISDADKVRLFSEANQLFRQANELATKDKALAATEYSKAILRFEGLIKAGITNGKLYYNIANCYVRLGDVGRAILNYRRAEQFLPGDENLRQNLIHTRSLRKDRIELREQEKILKTLFFWHYDLPVKARGGLLGFSYLAFWAFIIVKFFHRSKGANWGAGIALCFTMLMSGSLLADRWTDIRAKAGVVVADEVIGRMGDGMSYAPSFKEPLHGGVEFQLIENRGDWLHVELPDGRRSWLPVESSEFVSISEKQRPG